jgi:hypothetical protein
MPRTLADVENDIDLWVTQSGVTFGSGYLDPSGKAWMLKFFPPQYLAGFMRRPELVVSTTPGFTWGDGVYVVPLQHVYSAMIYGRVGVMGWIDKADLARVYDASDLVGVSLYKEWIQFKPGLFTLLTTTVHSNFANRRLRNVFRQRFKLDLVLFRPDEFNRAYVQPMRDRWCVVADFPGGTALPAGTVGFSRRIRDCELVAIGSEEFIVDKTGFIRQDLIGPELSGPAAIRLASGRVSLTTPLMNAYQANRSRGPNPPTFVLARP